MQTIKDILTGVTEDTRKLRAGEITPEQAGAVARLTQVYINTLKLEIQAGPQIVKIVGS